MIDIFVAVFLSCSVIPAGMAQDANTPQERAEQATQIVQLFENVANIKLTLEPIPREIMSRKTDEDTRKEFFRKRRLKYRKRKAELDKAIGQLAERGEVVIEPIMSRVRAEEDIKKRALLGNRTADVLIRIGTPKAHKALTDMVLGRNGLNRFKSSHVSGIFLRMVKNSLDVQKKLDARELLRLSNNKDFVGRVLNALHGVPIDPELLEQLVGILQSNDYYTIFCAVRVMGTAPTEAFVKEKVSAIVELLKTVEEMPKAHERYQNDRFGTFADNLYKELIKALIEMKGADAPLEEFTNKLTGMPRTCLIIARANRGDASVKGELRDILTQPAMVERTLMRLSAVRAFERIGTADDLPFLRQLAETETVEVLMYPGGSNVVEMIDGKPINNAGERAVVIPSDYVSGWSKATRWFLVQPAAHRAIQIIENKR
jgi:hypothetical protein